MASVRNNLAETKSQPDGEPEPENAQDKSPDSVISHIIPILPQLLKDENLRVQIRTIGGIPNLLACLKDSFQRVASTGSSSSENSAVVSFIEVDLSNAKIADQIKGCTAICEILYELAKEEFAAQQIVRENGINLLGKHLLIRAGTYGAQNHAAPEVIVTAEDGEKIQSQSSNTVSQDIHDFSLNVVQCLQVQVFRTLRRLAQLERHRRLIKSLLPATILAELLGTLAISVEQTDYQRLVDRMTCLGVSEQTRLVEGVRSCDLDKPSTHWIREYAILELLGSGAFGQVYKARKDSTDGSPQQIFAIKEVNTTQAIFGRNAEERQKSVRCILNEVNIIKQQLRHPNIVRYYKTFLHGDRLYIVMEMIEGLPLTELISSMKEKEEYFKEDRIWHVFTQLVLALRYLHRDKGIVHRDLSSNNIMIGEGDKVTITDFGLARQKQWDSSKMTSSVGTLVYSCPEIVQNKPYGEGADIWSIGCILYQMCTHKPPFQAECILTVASRIVSGQFEPVCNVSKQAYSEVMERVIQACLTADPQKRPDIIGVASYLTEILLKQLDSARQTTFMAKRRLKEFRDQFRLSSSTGALTQPVRFNETPRPQSCKTVPKSDNSLIRRRSSGGQSPQRQTEKLLETREPSSAAKATQKPSTSTRVTIPQRCLKPLNDPILDIVGVIHKLEYASLHCSVSNRRYCALKQFIENYRKRLFSTAILPSVVKQELIQLARKSTNTVNPVLLALQPHDNNGANEKIDDLTAVTIKALKEYGVTIQENNSVTYEMIMTVIETLLRECSNYYSPGRKDRAS